MRFDNISREGWVILAFFFFLATQEAGFGAIVFLLLMLFMARALSNNQQQRSPAERHRNRRVVIEDRNDQRRSRRNSQRQSRRNERGDTRGDRRGDVGGDYYEEEVPRSSSDSVHIHALDAVRAAGRNPDKLAVLPVDIGVLSFKDNDEPIINRDWEVMDDVDYVQPFVQLRLPRDANGKIRFELFDANDELVFVHEDDYQFVRGRNLVLPSTRLPVHDEQMKNDQWKLHVRADDLLIAEHVVTWADPDTVSDDFRRHVEADGEISNELRAMLAESRLEEMSLDDLLSYQDDDEQSSFQR